MALCLTNNHRASLFQDLFCLTREQQEQPREQSSSPKPPAHNANANTVHPPPCGDLEPPPTSYFHKTSQSASFVETHLFHVPSESRIQLPTSYAPNRQHLPAWEIERLQRLLEHSSCFIEVKREVPVGCRQMEEKLTAQFAQRFDKMES